MKTKDKQIREFKVVRNVLVVFLVLLGLFFITAVLFPSFDHRYRDLKQELQSCQEQMGLRFRCEIDGHWLNIISHDNYSIYSYNLIWYGFDELEEELIPYDLKISDCEVIE